MQVLKKVNVTIHEWLDDQPHRIVKVVQNVYILKHRAYIIYGNQKLNVNLNKGVGWSAKRHIRTIRVLSGQESLDQLKSIHEEQKP